MAMPQVQMDMVEPTIQPPEQQFAAAADSRDPAALLDVAKSNLDSPVGQAAMGLANHLYKTSKQFDDLVAPIVKAGGPQTPQGRMEAVKIFESSKTDPSLGEVLMHIVTGNGAYARDLVTGGKVTAEIRPDREGRMVKVWSNAFGPTRARQLGSNQDMTETEFEERGVGRQKYEDTLSYLRGKQINEQNTKDWLKKTERDSVTSQMYKGEIEPIAGQMLSDLQELQDVDPNVRLNVLKFVNYATSNASSANESRSSLAQAQANASQNIGKDVEEKKAVQWGLPAGVYKYTKEGVQNVKGGENYSWDRLNNLQSTSSRSNQLEDRFNTDSSAMLKYLRAHPLSKDPEQAQALQDKVLSIYTNSKRLGASLMKVHDGENAPKYLMTPNVSDSDDPYSLIQGKMVQLLTNGRLIRLQDEYSRQAKKEFDAGANVNPYAIESAFTSTPEFRQEIKNGMDLTNQLVTDTARRNKERLDRQGVSLAPMAPPTNRVAATPGIAAPSVSIEAPSVEQEATKNRAALTNRGAPMLPPEGMVQIGIDPRTGKPVFDKRGK